MTQISNSAPDCAKTESSDIFNAGAALKVGMMIEKQVFSKIFSVNGFGKVSPFSVCCFGRRVELSMKFLKTMVRSGLQRAGYSIVKETSSKGDAASILQDQYIEYLQRFIGGFLEEGNIVAFERAIQEMPEEGAIVEIGAFLGLSTNIIAHLLHISKSDTRFFTCDPWHYGEGGLRSPHFTTDTREFDSWAHQAYQLNTRLFNAGREPLTFQMTSDEFFELWKNQGQSADLFGRTVALGGPIAFCYIDGDHSYEATKKDFDNVHRHLLNRGFIVFDDSAHTSYCPGVQRVVREVLETGNYRVVLENPNFCLQRIAL